LMTWSWHCAPYLHFPSFPTRRSSDLDSGETFAEKWNRPLDGHRYRRAFQEWYENASVSVSLGLESFESAEAFAKAVNENFGIGRSEEHTAELQSREKPRMPSAA